MLEIGAKGRFCQFVAQVRLQVHLSQWLKSKEHKSKLEYKIGHVENYMVLPFLSADS